MKKIYDLTSVQKAIWKTEQFIPNTSINNVSGTIKVKEKIHPKIYEKAVNFLLQNESLRLRFKISNNEPVQYVSKYKYYKLFVFDLSTDENLNNFFKLEEELIKTPFNLIDSDLFYFALIKLPEETALFFKAHHIIADGWAMGLIVDQTLNFYLELKKNYRPKPFIQPSYIDYIQSEKEYLSSERFIKNKAYWQSKIQTMPEFVSFKNKSICCSNKMKRTSFLIPSDLSQDLKKRSAEQNVSVFILFKAALLIYINYVTSKKDISLGTTVLNRASIKEKSIIGMFTNVLPVRISVDNKENYNSFIHTLNANWKTILKNQRYPHDLISKEYRHIHKSTEDLFDITISFQNAVFEQRVNFKGFKSRWHSPNYQLNSLNIHIANREDSDNYVIHFDHLVEVFSEYEMKQLYDHLTNIIKDALKNPFKQLVCLEILSETEKKKILYDFNNTPDYSDITRILHQLFEVQAQKTPENIVLVFDELHLTYRELNNRSDKLASFLRIKGIKANDIVGLFVKRSIEMIIGILGILKAGGAYLSIDINCPKERINFILRDCKCPILLTNISIDLEEWDGEIININSIPETENCLSLINLSHPNDLAYVIYTSGSTGNPKGVMIEHHSIVNTIKWRIRHYDFNEHDVLLQIPPYNFDSSVEDIFSFLCVGAKIIIIDQCRQHDLIYLKELILAHKVTHFLVTPLLYKIMLDEIASVLNRLSRITVAGEDFQIGLVKKHFEKIPHVKLFNEYGPTENSVCSTVYQFSQNDEEVLIGKPISNCRCYVLNLDFNLLPIGISGELYLGGPGLARGYLNNPELTKEKFLYVPNINEWLYKTGDIVKWTPEGNLKFIERIDNQIKIRGFRVELDEIKNTILLFKAIKDAVVLAKEGRNSNTFICAYLVANYLFDLSELKEFLNLRLPDYMIPSYFVFIDSIPLSHNGKIDKTKLPEINEKEKIIIKPETEIEIRLAEAWREVLKVDIGISNDIFEYGADSIAIIRVLTILYKNNWNLSVQDFYKYRTIKELADHINSTKLLPNAAKKGNGLIYKSNKTAQIYKDLSAKKSIDNIFLTGVTGFLGSHILYELLKTTEARVFCLVRGNNDTEALDKFNNIIRFYFPKIDENLLKQRVFIVRGDITKKNLGISELEYGQLFQRINTVIHAAALVKHYGKYSDFEKINIYGVEQIVNFCINKNLFHISTTSISGASSVSSSRKIRFSEEFFDIGQSFNDNFYIKSKFEAERIVRREMKNNRNFSIIRVGNLTGRYTDGHFQINISDNKFYNILKSIVELKSIPKSMLHQKIEFTPVDKCSEAIVKIILINESKGKTFHLVNNNLILIKDLIKMFRNYGYEIKPLNDNDFYGNLKTISDDWTQRHVLFGIITDIQNGRLNYNSSVIIDSRFTRSFLRLLQFQWPVINEEYFLKIIEYIDKVNFFRK